MRLNSWEGQLAAGARRQMAGWDVPAREDAEDGPGPEEPAAAAYPISPVSSATIPVRRRFVSAGGFNGALAMEGRPSFFLSLSLSLSLCVCVSQWALPADSFLTRHELNLTGRLLPSNPTVSPGKNIVWGRSLTHTHTHTEMPNNAKIDNLATPK